MWRPPSYKQKKLVDWIVHTYHVERPKYTAKAYWYFINNNQHLWKKYYWNWRVDEDESISDVSAII